MRLAGLTLVVLLVCSCATAPTPSNSIPVNIVGCSSNLIPPPMVGGDPRVALVILGLGVGYDVAAYGTCEAGKLLHPAPAAMVSDDVYRSGRDTFSVGLPLPPPNIQKPSINIVQPSLLPSDNAMFWLLQDGAPLKSGAIAFGAGTSAETEAQLSEPLPQLAVAQLHRSAMTTDRLGSDTLSLLHHEPATLDGHPAIFATFRSTARVIGNSKPLYVFTYFTRDQTRSAALVIFWQGGCPVCDEGNEADIRKLDPSIERFVDSFRLNEAVIATLKPAVDSSKPPASSQALYRITAPPGKALIFFYREWNFVGGGIDLYIEDKGNDVVALSNGSYFRLAVDPGTHAFTLSRSSGIVGNCEVQVKSGEILYLDVLLAPTCQEVGDLDALAEMAKLKELN